MLTLSSALSPIDVFTASRVPFDKQIHLYTRVGHWSRAGPFPPELLMFDEL